MILVLNHLLPSNGSRLITYFLFVPAFVLLFSCRTTKPGKEDPEIVEVVLPDRPETPEVDLPDADTISIDDDIFGTDEDKPAAGKFRIALLLPFHIDDYHPEVQDPASANISRSTRMAVEYYQGFRYVLEHLAPKGFEAEIHVFDTKNDPAATRRILNDPDFPKADLMVGPVFNKNLRIAAAYCKENKIPMISPLSSSSSITTDNPYYYTANGTSHAHYEALANYIQKTYPGDTIHVIHNGTAQERDIIDQFQAIRWAVFDTTAAPVIEIQMTTEANTFDLKSEFDSLSTHIVFIPSYDEIFSNYALNQLAQIKNYYPSIVFGMPTWINFEDANYDYFEWLQVHLSESVFIDEEDPLVQAAWRDLSLEYGIEPTEFTFQGYDLAHFAMAYLMNRPMSRKEREQFFTISNPVVGIQSGYLFVPRYPDDREEKTERIDYWDNRYIHVLKFEHYRYNKADK